MFPVLHYITIVNFIPLLLNDQTFWGPLLTEEISTFCYFWYSWLVLILQYHFKEFNNFMESNSNLTRLVLLLEHAFTILRFTIDNKFGYTLSDRKPILWSQFSEAYSVASLRCRANRYNLVLKQQNTDTMLDAFLCTRKRTTSHYWLKCVRFQREGKQHS